MTASGAEVFFRPTCCSQSAPPAFSGFVQTFRSFIRLSSLLISFSTFPGLKRPSSFCIRFALICGVCLSFPLVTVKSLFPRPHGERVMAAVVFDEKARQELQNHLFSSDKKLVRVLDLTSEPNEGFPKNTGWYFKSGDRRVFNFLGYDLHLNASADYLNMMGGGSACTMSTMSAPRASTTLSGKRTIRTN
jgi:hypothetical protein